MSIGSNREKVLIGNFFSSSSSNCFNSKPNLTNSPTLLLEGEGKVRRKIGTGNQING